VGDRWLDLDQLPGGRAFLGRTATSWS